MDTLKVRLHIGVGADVDLEVVLPGENDVEISIGDSEVIANHKLLGADELIVDVLQLLGGLAAQVLRHVVWECGVEQTAHGGMQLRGDVGEGVLELVSLMSAVRSADLDGASRMVSTTVNTLA